MSGIQLRRRPPWSSNHRHGRNNYRHQYQQPWTVSTTTANDHHEEMVIKYGIPALLSLMALKYQQGIQTSTPFETHPWLMSISIFGVLLYFSSGNIILRLINSIAIQNASSTGSNSLMLMSMKILRNIIGFSVVSILASLLCHPDHLIQHSTITSSNSSRSLVYMTFIILSVLIITTYYSLIVSCFHWLRHTILALFLRSIQRSQNREASTTSVEQANVHYDIESLPSINPEISKQRSVDDISRASQCSWLHHTILALFHRSIQRSPNREASTTSVEQANIHDDIESLSV